MHPGARDITPEFSFGDHFGFSAVLVLVPCVCERIHSSFIFSTFHRQAADGKANTMGLQRDLETKRIPSEVSFPGTVDESQGLLRKSIQINLGDNMSRLQPAQQTEELYKSPVLSHSQSLNALWNLYLPNIYPQHPLTFHLQSLISTFYTEGTYTHTHTYIYIYGRGTTPL